MKKISLELWIVVPDDAEEEGEQALLDELADLQEQYCEASLIVITDTNEPLNITPWIAEMIRGNEDKAPSTVYPKLAAALATQVNHGEAKNELDQPV